MSRGLKKTELPQIRVATASGLNVETPALGDELDKFLARVDDPSDWRTLPSSFDLDFHKAERTLKLTADELDIIRRIQEGEVADAGYDPYQPAVDFFTYKARQTPILDAPEPKRRFLPSKWEAKRIVRIVRAIRKGLIVPGAARPGREVRRYYDLWGSENGQTFHRPHHIPPPKMKLPGHIESYNPPEEYTLTAEEEKRRQAVDGQQQSTKFLPRKYDSLRRVPAYARFVQERFSRCLDLYLCPRARRIKLNIDPESLLPRLPDPRDLRPFPTRLAIRYVGHEKPVRAASVDPTGQWLLTGAEDHTVRLWEVQSGRCLQTWNYTDTISSVTWNPNRDIPIFAVASGEATELIMPLICRGAFTLEQSQGSTIGSVLQWQNMDGAGVAEGRIIQIQHKNPVTTVCWHRKGDYFATLTLNGGSRAVAVHQLSRRISQHPFAKLRGLPTRILFHPTRPHFLISTQKYVRIYDLSQQRLVRKLIPGVENVSTIDVHPLGDNVIVGSLDRRMCWFDLDFSAKPYKSLQYHSAAIRSAVFHPRLSLFATAGDDGAIHVFHGQVYQDLSQNPLIVPVRILEAPTKTAIIQIQFHPIQPWIFSTGYDGSVSLYV